MPRFTVYFNQQIELENGIFGTSLSGDKVHHGDIWTTIRLEENNRIYRVPNTSIGFTMDIDPQPSEDKY